MIEETLEKILAELVKLNSYYLAHSLVEIEGSGEQLVDGARIDKNDDHQTPKCTSTDSKPGSVMFEGKQYSDFKPCKPPKGGFCDGFVSWEHRKPVEGDHKSFLPVHFTKDKVPTGRGCPTY